ncbi:hydroxyacylglutathione hydrolase [Alteromonas oceanisediminis]|uniref:hydroxyacylglutathione hydrolase n=1 Tax=Alteromonas oceanisediminis TaxID=2836180 RepID=UPI001BD9DD47|nr:hydroxyacylglutathione hydrolase [Alteromonas oceanisediminis]MBT0587397.1 hydroxyacylglutathione hydrolase [Alteromonas oceanisediminis]
MRHALPQNVTVTPLPAFTDNYIWCFEDQHRCIVVDPGDGQVVYDYCRTNNLNLEGILITHHHADHTGGLPLLKKHFPNTVVYGPKNPNIKLIDHRVSEGNKVSIDSLALQFEVIDVPGHTLDHIAFVGHGGVLCGDTLFSVGCGRLFEGTPKQMLASLQKLTALPGDTIVWCTHEYTLANIAFAQQVDPQNEALQEYHDWATSQREMQQPTLPTTIAKQREINPFLRAYADDVKANAQRHVQQELVDELAVFSAVRSWKDSF